MIAVAVTITATGAWLAPSAALASDDPAALEAKRHYEEGTKAFNLGEYPRAIAEFKATYNVKPDPLLLYNIAQSYRLAGDAAQALFFYKSFLRNLPDAENRREVEAQIRKLEKQVADQKKDPASAPPPVVVPAPLAAPSAPATTTMPPPAPASPPPAAPAPFPAGPAPQPEPRRPPPAPPTPTVHLDQPPPQQPGAQVDLTAPPAGPAPADEDRPLYKKWWFWAGIAGAAILVGGIAAANAKKPPSTTLGTYDPTFL